MRKFRACKPTDNITRRWGARLISGPLSLAIVVSMAAGPTAMAAPVVLTDDSSSAIGLTPTVDAFRAALGQLNPPDPVQKRSGRRQINWDAAPDAVSAPHAFPGDFFNFDASPRARGIEFSTPGTGFQLSATAASGVGERFKNLNASYAGEFKTFSEERLFSSIGSNITEVRFFAPDGSRNAATTNGFGAVFTDVDYANTTKLEFYGRTDDLLLTTFASPEDKGLSFAGAVFDDPIIAFVRITAGNSALGLNDGSGIDVVALDDFIFGEPQPVPLPASVALLVPALGALAGFKHKRKRWVPHTCV